MQKVLATGLIQGKNFYAGRFMIVLEHLDELKQLVMLYKLGEDEFTLFDCL